MSNISTMHFLKYFEYSNVMGYAFKKWDDFMIFVKCNYWKLISTKIFVTITVEEIVKFLKIKIIVKKKFYSAQTPKNAASLDKGNPL